MMTKSGQIRIIGGRWKSRRLRCAGASDLRPSPDAVRETLFNWLPGQWRDKSCLDLFAGSGAFGFEAASRGALKVVMVESHPQAVGLLRANLGALQAEDRVRIFPWRVERFLQKHEDGFDVIFLDPPFRAPLIKATCEHLHKRGFLNPEALVYIESKHAADPLPIPAAWRIIREKRCGMVQSTLVQT